MGDTPAKARSPCRRGLDTKVRVVDGPVDSPVDHPVVVIVVVVGGGGGSSTANKSSSAPGTCHCYQPYGYFAHLLVEWTAANKIDAVLCSGEIPLRVLRERGASMYERTHECFWPCSSRTSYPSCLRNPSAPQTSLARLSYAPSMVHYLTTPPFYAI